MSDEETNQKKPRKKTRELYLRNFAAKKRRL